MTFEALKLSEPLQRAVREEGYTSPTPIQARAIPPALEGRDVLGCAQTGTGKTAAFALPVLQRLSGSPAPKGRPIRCLVLTPTRELASQIGDSFRAYGRHTGLRHAVIFGGVSQHAQVQALQRGLEILVATPGRLLDLMQQGFVALQSVEVFVLDEADRMLDMGFIHDVKKIIAKLPTRRQTLFFSATMPPEISALSKNILVNPQRVEVTPVSTAAETVEQRMYFVEREHKRALLLHVLADPEVSRALVFTRTKNGANRVARHLAQARIRADAIHGNKSQNARERALAALRGGEIRVLVATDIAARGLDIEGVSHVINFDLPNLPESYVHRIGRTGRAAATGVALSFCDRDERAYLPDIERLLRGTVPVVKDHPFEGKAAAPRPAPAPQRGRPDAAPRSGPRRDRGGRSQRRKGGGGPPPRSAQAAPAPAAPAPRPARPAPPKFM